jgi:O-methyltransferase
MTLPKLSPGDPDLIPDFVIPMNWMIKDPARFNELMREARTLVEGGVYFGDNLFTWSRNNSLFDDAAFREAWQSNCMNASDQAIAWRRYIAATLAHHALQIPGDFVECGVFQGTGVKTVIDYLGGKSFPKIFWAFDTFDYNPVPGHDSTGQTKGFFETVKARFDGYDQVKLVMGLIPDVFMEHLPQQIAYLHIDLNDAAAEIATLEALFERVVPGGVVIFDDYEWSGVYRRQKLAEDEWLDRRNVRVVPLPTGQGFVIKR